MCAPVCVCVCCICVWSGSKDLMKDLRYLLKWVGKLNLPNLKMPNRVTGISSLSYEMGCSNSC